MKLNILSSSIALALVSPLATAGIVETEENDTQATANTVIYSEVDANTHHFSGMLEGPAPLGNILDVLTPAYSVPGNFLLPGLVSFFEVPVVDAGTPFVAITDNSASGVDTMLGHFDGNGVLISVDDDSSPLGDGFADGLFGVSDDADGDGSESINLRVTGCCDFDFNGSHSQGGAYDLHVFTGDDALAATAYLGYGGYGGDGYGGFGGGDVDFVTFDGLNPGDLFIAQLFGDINVAGFGGDGDGAFAPRALAAGPEGNNLTPEDGTLGVSHDGLLGLFNDSEVLIAADNAQGDPSVRIGGVVSSSGALNFGISEFHDTGFDGTYAGVGDYELVLKTFTLGDPGGPPIDDIVELPDEPPAEPGDPFVFVDLVVEDGQIVNLDPVVAVGYDYKIEAGSGSFAKVTLPMVGLDGEFELSFLNDANVWQTETLLAGVMFDFLTNGAASGVDYFEVRGIDLADAPDTADPDFATAFITAVSFIGTNTSDPLTISQDPFTIDTDANNVPVPGALALLGAGLLAGGVARRRRKDKLS